MATKIEDEQILWKTVRRGQHVRACRKLGLFEHHGVVIAEPDLKRIEPSIWPKKIEPFLVAEQNTKGLRIVTLEDFCTDYLFKPVVYKLNIVQYSADTGKLHISRPGACRQRASVSEDEIIENVIAILNSPQQRAMWESYSICVRNCEQFAVLCCTSIPSLGCQISACLQGTKCVFLNGARVGIKAVYDLLINAAKGSILRIGEKLGPSAMSAGAVTAIDDIIQTSLRGNAVAAAISFGIETIILTVRVLIYHFSSEEKREIYLARDWVITWDDYVKRMTQAGLANLAAFGFSVLGLLVGVAFGGVGAIPLSIIFGLIGYIGTRWLTGIVYDKVRQRVGGKGNKRINQQMNKMNSQMARIRHENVIHELRTDLHHLQMKASSLQRQISSTIKEIRSSVYAVVEGPLKLQEAAHFIQGDLEYLYKQIDALGVQHDAIIKRFEEKHFPDNQEHQLLLSMMGEIDVSLFELRLRIEDLATSIRSTLDLNHETERKAILENILDTCDQLNTINDDLVAE